MDEMLDLVWGQCLAKSKTLFDQVNEKVSELSAWLYKAAAENNVNKVNSRTKNKRRKNSWIDNECKVKYKCIKYLSWQIGANPWDKHLRQKLSFTKKELNKLTRKKHRLFRSKIINNILEVGKKISRSSPNPSSNISHQEWRDYFYKLMNVEHVNNLSADNTV